MNLSQTKDMTAVNRGPQKTGHHTVCDNFVMNLN